MVALAVAVVAVLLVDHPEPKAQVAVVQEILVLMVYQILVAIQVMLLVVLVEQILAVVADVLEHGVLVMAELVVLVL
jgi:hypothetical protein